MFKIKRITITDIAKRMSISANTVSKALNGKDKVSKELREKIIKTAEEMGYKKNVYAASLSKKPVKIGILINGYDENYYSYTIKGFNKAAEYLADRLVELDVRVVKATEDKTEALNVLKEFIYDGSSGVIINDLITQNLLPVLEEYDKRGIKYAFLNYDIAEAPRCFAMVNDYNGAAGLAAELLSLCTKPESTLAVISHNVPSETQKKLAEGFNKKALELGKTKIVNVSSIDDLLDNDSIGGIYVSHASYLEICQKIEKEWNKDNRPKTVVSDLYEEGVPYIENGVITAVIFQDPEKQAFVTANSLYELLSEGKRCDSLLTVDPMIVMKSNYKKYL